MTSEKRLIADLAREREAALRRGTHCIVGRVTLKPHAIVAGMAQTIVARVQQRGEATERDLIAAGYSARDIHRLGAEALAAARPRLGRHPLPEAA